MRFVEPDAARRRGRAGVAQRKRRLAAEPLCRHCMAKGRITPATVPDHIQPLAFGGKDTEENIQCLCRECHDIKTAIEGASVGGHANHPNWLKPSAIPLKIVCGPPCAGKTTYVLQRATAADVVIDVDAITTYLSPSYTHWAGPTDGQLVNQAIRVRNTMLGSLQRQSRSRAWFIVAAPTQAERGWWQAKLGGEVVLLHPGVDECKRRAMQRGTPLAVSGIDRWEKQSRMPWHSPELPIARGDDGWPVDPRWASTRQ